MQDAIRSRLESLRQEMSKGRERLQELEQQQQQLRDMLLRISGAIQVLEELQSEALSPVESTRNGAADRERVGS
jgi:predicted nuclease with TOPRIM domain